MGIYPPTLTPHRRVCTYTHMHACAHTFQHSHHIHVCAHTRVCTYTHRHTCMCTQYPLTLTPHRRVHTHTCMRVHIPSDTHTTHVCAHTHTHNLRISQVSPRVSPIVPWGSEEAAIFLCGVLHPFPSFPWIPRRVLHPAADCSEGIRSCCSLMAVSGPKMETR